MRCWLTVGAMVGLLVSGCGEVVQGEPPLNCLPGHEQVGERCVVKEIYFKGGWFTLGRGYCDPPEAHADEFTSGVCELRDAPHEVFVAPFYMDATEVTSGADMLSVGLSVDECPTFEVSCGDAHVLGPQSAPTIEYALEVCERMGKTLPTEAQWELAASGFGERTYPWGEQPPSCEHLDLGLKNCSYLGRVGRYPPSPEGLYDLAGGMGEFVLPDTEGYSDSYTPIPIVEQIMEWDCDPGVSSTCPVYLQGIRGGDGWLDDKAYRSAHRRTSDHYESFGFRCVRNADTDASK